MTYAQRSAARGALQLPALPALLSCDSAARGTRRLEIVRCALRERAPALSSPLSSLPQPVRAACVRRLGGALRTHRLGELRAGGAASTKPSARSAVQMMPHSARAKWPRTRPEHTHNALCSVVR